MYHKEYAPHGRSFNVESGQTPESLALEDWVDSPAKIGVNEWGPEAEEAVARTAAEFQRGRLAPVDSAKTMTDDQVLEAARRILDERAEEARLRGDQANRSEAQALQRSKDMVADAERKAEKEPSAQVQVPGAGQPDTEAGRRVAIKEALNKVDRNHEPNLNADKSVKMEVLEAMLDFNPSMAERDDAQAELDAEAKNAL